MTLHELSQLYWIKKEIRADERRLRVLRQSMGVPSPVSDGMPRSTDVHSRTERIALDIVELEEIIQEKQARCLREQVRLERYIAAIPDSLTRQVFTERFIECRSWQGVASHIGGGNTAEGVRKVCYRYLREAE